MTPTAALLAGTPLEDAALRGNAIGAWVAQFPGDCDGLPDRAQLAGALQSPRTMPRRLRS